MIRRFHSHPIGLSLNAIPQHQEFVGGRWIDYAQVIVHFAPHYETDDPRLIRAIRSAKGYGTSYFETDPETNRATTFPVDYGLTPEAKDKPQEGKPVIIQAKDLTRK